MSPADTLALAERLEAFAELRAVSGHIAFSDTLTQAAAALRESVSEIEGLKAERDAAMTLDKGFYEWMVERDLLARGEEVDWSDIVVALTEHEIECCPDPLRTQAPDSWRPDREAVAREVWIGFTGNPGTWGRAKNTANETVKYCWTSADRILALRPQTAESGE